LLGNHEKMLIHPTEPVNGKVGPFLIYLVEPVRKFVFGSKTERTGK
jgi:hypothetical protein